MVDRIFHRVVSYEPADFAEEDGRIVMRIKRGFLWRDQVLRPEEVVAKRFQLAFLRSNLNVRPVTRHGSAVEFPPHIRHGNCT